MVTCKICNTQFEPLWPDAKDQADGCACEILVREGKRYLLGYYGSKYDGQLWEIDGIVPIPVVCPICDSCADNMLNDQILTRVPGEYPFPLTAPLSGPSETNMDACKWEADKQREALERHGLMDLYMGCDSIDRVCEALIAARKMRDEAIRAFDKYSVHNLDCKVRNRGYIEYLEKAPFSMDARECTCGLFDTLFQFGVKAHL